MKWIFLVDDRGVILMLYDGLMETLTCINS